MNTFSEELLRASNGQIEAALTSVLLDEFAKLTDEALSDDNPGNDVQPPGLRVGIVSIPSADMRPILLSWPPRWPPPKREPRP